MVPLPRRAGKIPAGALAGALVLLSGCGERAGLPTGSANKSPEPSDIAMQQTQQRAPKEAPTSFPPPPPPIYQMGLVARADVDPYLAKSISVNNAFGGTYRGLYYYLIAGAPAPASEAGQLFVVTANADVDTGPQQYRRYTPPGTPHGSLTVTAGALPLIMLQAADGTQYTFDVRTGDFTIDGSA